MICPQTIDILSRTALFACNQEISNEALEFFVDLVKKEWG
jgi:hypothetical protein